MQPFSKYMGHTNMRDLYKERSEHEIIATKYYIINPKGPQTSIFMFMRNSLGEVLQGLWTQVILLVIDGTFSKP